MVITMIYAFQYIIELPTSSILLSDVPMFNQFNFWLMAEFGICMFSLITTALYLLVRLFKDQKIDLNIPNGGKALETDFVVYNHLVIGVLNAFCAPSFLITCIVLYLFDDKSPEYKLWKTQMILGWFQVIVVFYLVFVTSVKAPKWWESYVLWSGYIHGTLASLNFIVIPICTIVNVSRNWSLIDNAKTAYFIAFIFWL